MNFTAQSIPGVFLIEPIIHKDNRGYFVETFKQDLFEKAIGYKINFLQDNESKSTKGVLRGLHYQLNKPQGKFISVLKGEILDVVVDLRKKSKTFGKHFKIILSEKNSKSIYIPPGFLHGFLGLDKENTVIYGCTNYRDKNSEIGVKWNDEELKINWTTKIPILSKKDKKNLRFQEVRF